MKFLRNVLVAAMLALAPAALVLAPVAEAAVTYSATAKTNRMTAVRDLLNGGKLEVLHSDGTTILVTWTLSATSGTVSGNVLTFSFTSTAATASATGTCTTGRFRTSANADVITGLTCAQGSGEVNVSATSIGSGATITVTGATVTHASLQGMNLRFAQVGDLFVVTVL